MVARSPPKEKKMAAPLNPNLLRETVKKVDMCMARLQELQYTVSGGKKVIAGVSLSPRSTRGYLRTSLRCKQESLKIKDVASRISPGKMLQSTGGEWRRMSLPAMLVGETVGEILQASRFAKEVVIAATKIEEKLPSGAAKTPVSNQKNNPHPESSQLRSRRKMEKQGVLQSIRSESNSSPHRRIRSRINFKVYSPTKKREFGKENLHTAANRVSPRNRPWAKKTVLFPNPLFVSTPSQQPQFCKTRSPIIAKARQTTPHKFIIKSPPSSSKNQARNRVAPTSLSPTRAEITIKKSPKVPTASKLRRSFSPSRLATRLVSPLKNRISAPKSNGLISGLKQRPISTPVRLSGRRNFMDPSLDCH